MADLFAYSDSTVSTSLEVCGNRETPPISPLATASIAVTHISTADSADLIDKRTKFMCGPVAM